MKKNHRFALALLGVLALGAGAWASARQPAKTPAPPAPVAPAQARLSAEDSQGFRASEFEGVSVRNRPSGASKPAAASKGWIALKPGTPRSSASGGISTRSVGGWRVVEAPAKFGGRKIVGPGLMRSEIATRLPNGRIVLQCAPGETVAQHAAHVSHAAPHAKATR